MIEEKPLDGASNLSGTVNAARPPAMRTFPSGYLEEDEINLLDLLTILLEHKWLIFWIVFLTGTMAVRYNLRLPNIYRSECTIAPTSQEESGGYGAMIASELGIGGAGSLEQFDVVLKSRDLTNTIVRQYDLLHVFYATSWDAANRRWKVERPPTIQDAYGTMQGMLKITPDKKKNIFNISVEHRDPMMTQMILNYYIVGMSEFLRQQIMEGAAAQQMALRQQLVKTSDPLLKNLIYELIANQIEKQTLARVPKYYGFNVIDPPFVPEKNFKPRRLQNCIIAVVVAFFVSIFLALFVEYVKNFRSCVDQKRLANLRDSLRLRLRS